MTDAEGGESLIGNVVGSPPKIGPGQPWATVLTIPESSWHVYLRILKGPLEARGLRIEEAPLPSLRWPRNLIKLAARLVHRPDLCQLHWDTFDSRILLRLFLATRVPKVWTVHTLVPNVASLRGDLRVTAAYLGAVDVAVWHSQRTLDEARKRFALRRLPTSWHAKDVLIPCVSFNRHFPDTISKAEARRRLGLEPSHFVVGHYGPSGRYKGTERVLELAAKTPETDVRFCMFGRCNEPSLEEKILVAGRALPNLKVNLDFIPDEELQVWFNACDVIVQPYLDITTSGTLMFAIAFRRPVIASPLGNVPDLVRPGETGWLASSPDQIRQCIQEARDSPAATAEMGERAFELADRMANVDSVADRYAKAYALALTR